MTDKLTHCVCGCIYKESNCPNCNKVTDNQRIEELEAQVEGCLAVIATERAEVLALRRKLAKVVGALESLTTCVEDSFTWVAETEVMDDSRTTLAELKGETK